MSKTNSLIGYSATGTYYSFAPKNVSPCLQQTTSCHQGSQTSALAFLAVPQRNMFCFCPAIKFKAVMNNSCCLST